MLKSKRYKNKQKEKKKEKEEETIITITTVTNKNMDTKQWALSSAHCVSGTKNYSTNVIPINSQNAFIKWVFSIV